MKCGRHFYCVFLIAGWSAMPCCAIEGTDGSADDAGTVAKDNAHADDQIVPQVALDHMKRGEFEAALPFFREAVRQNPQNGKAHNGLGVCFTALQKADEAITELKEAVRLDPRNAKYHTDLGLAFAMQGDREQTLHHLDRATQLAPDDPRPLIEAGKIHYLSGDFPKSAEMWSNALALESSPETQVFRASAYRRSREFGKAIKDCDAILKESPDDHNALACRAFSRMRSGDLEGARQDAERVIAARETTAYVGYLVRGGVSVMRGELEVADRDLSMAAELDPQRPLPCVLRAFVRFTKGEIPNSIKDLETATKISSDPQKLNYELDGYGWQVYKFRGLLKSCYAGRHEEAIADLNQAIELNGRDPHCFALRGMAHLYQSNWSNAIVDFEMAKKISPEDAWANYWLVQVLTAAPDDKLRDGPRAIQLAEAANERSPNQPVILAQLAAAYSEAGRFSKAEQIQGEVMKMLLRENARTTLSTEVCWGSDFELHFSRSRQSNQELLEMYKQKKPYRLARQDLKDGRKPSLTRPIND